MNRQPIHHPYWCGRSHVCSADRPGGEHRSHPYTVDSDTVRLVVTRIRTTHGIERLEVRLVADLPTDPEHAHRLAMVLLGRVHRAVSRAAPRSRS
jgi:hypothetical protein